MLKSSFRIVSVGLISLISACSLSSTDCVIRTEVGDIGIELYEKKAPVTVSNFLRYVDSGYYDNSTFFRVCTPANEADRDVPIQIIQGGDIAEDLLFPPIDIETTGITGIHHKNGTISMARSDPNSARSSYFICILDQPELDHHGKRNPDGFGFAAFGRVSFGMDVVQKIQSGSNSAQMLIEPIEVYTIERPN